MPKLSEKTMKFVFMASAGFSIIAVFLICFFIFAGGLPAIFEIGPSNFLSGTEWKPNQDLFGVFPMILGSLYVTFGAIVIGVPIAVLSALYMSFFASEKILKIVKPLVNLLAGIPSIVYGFFGVMVLVPFVRDFIGGRGTSMLSASIILGVMILPTIVGVSKASLDQVPKSYYEGSLALGASHERTVFRVLLPAAKSGVTAAIILGVGRAIGETMAVIMVAGNQAIIPQGILKGLRTLTANIVIEMGYAQDLHKDALVATAVVLFSFILIINVIFNLIKRKASNE